MVFHSQFAQMTLNFPWLFQKSMAKSKKLILWTYFWRIKLGFKISENYAFLKAILCVTKTNTYTVRKNWPDTAWSLLIVE